MKNLPLFCLPLLLFFLFSCEKEETVSTNTEDYIANIVMLNSSSVQVEQEIEVTIHKGTPCQFVSKVVQTGSGNTVNYNFILGGQEEGCITLAVKEVVTVVFDPSNPGDYTLNFLINGELFETRTVTVTN